MRPLPAAVLGLVAALSAPAQAVTFNEDGMPIFAGAPPVPDGPRGEALALGRDMTQAALDGDLDRARALRRAFLSLDAAVLAAVPWPPLIDAVGSTEAPPDRASLRPWHGALPADDFIVVFWLPHRGDMQPVIEALADDMDAGGPPVVAVTVGPDRSGRALGLARALPEVVFATVDGAGADQWQATLSQNCLYVADDQIQQRFACRELRGLAPDGPPSR